MGEGSIFSKVKVPIKCFWGKLMLLDSPHEQFQAESTLASPDNFAVPLRGQNIDAESQLRPVGIWLHVKGLNLRRVAMNHHRQVILLRKHCFIPAPEIPTPLHG